MTRPVEGNKI